MLVGALSSQSSWTLPVPSIVKEGTSRAYHAFKGAVGLEKKQPVTTWESLEARFWTAIDYAPDLWCLMNASVRIATEYLVKVPVALRMTIAAFASLNIFLIPKMSFVTLTSVWDLLRSLPSQSFTGLIEGVVKVVHLTGITSIVTLIGCVGVRDIFEKLMIPAEDLKRVIAFISPWISYVLRVSALVQLMDISSGMIANAEISHLLHRRSIVKKAFHAKESSAALKVLKSNLRLFSKSADAGEHLCCTIRKIDAQVNSWLPGVSLLGQWRADRLVKRMQIRNAALVNNQILGLAANATAAMSMMLAVNVVASSVFSMLSSVFFLSKTYHTHNAMN